MEAPKNQEVKSESTSSDVSNDFIMSIYAAHVSELLTVASTAFSNSSGRQKLVILTSWVAAMEKVASITKAFILNTCSIDEKDFDLTKSLFDGLFKEAVNRFMKDTGSIFLDPGSNRGATPS